MLKQFNVEQLIFDDAIVSYEGIMMRYGVTNENWVLVDDNKVNEISASITSGGTVWLENGEVKCSGKAPSEAHSFNLKTKQWTINAEKQAALLVKAKMQKLAEINSTAQNLVRQAAKLDETPQFERDTWLEQAKEAKAWIEDPTAQTPTLDLIAQMRGVPIDTLRQKAYEKAMAYQTVAAIIVGQRQGYEDRLEQAETLEQIQAIKPVYQLPQGANNEQTD